MALACVVACLGISTARAQSDLPAELVLKPTSLTAPERTRVRALVDEAIPLLTSNSAASIKRGRAALRKPLVNPAVSVSFRLAYSESLSPALEQVLRSDDTVARVNALRIAGEVATERAAQLAVRALDDPDATVRYTAAYAMGLTFTAIQNTTPAMTQDQATRLIRALGARLAVERDAFVLDRIIRSLGAAARIRRERMDQLRPHAIDEICEQVGSRMRQADEPVSARDLTPLIQMYLRAAEVVQQEFIAGDRLPESTMIKAGGFGGDALAFVARRLNDQRTGEQTQDQPDAQTIQRQHKLLVALAITGEAVTFFARSQLDPEHPHANYRIAEALSTGDAGAYQRDLAKLIGPGGDLTKPPFGFDPARFHL